MRLKRTRVRFSRLHAMRQIGAARGYGFRSASHSLTVTKRQPCAFK
jgi:hypothetical protein